MCQSEELLGNKILEESEIKESDLIKNIKGDNIDYSSIQIAALFEQQVESVKDDRELKKNTQKFIKIILSLCVGITLSLIVLNAIIKFFTDKELYSEWFLSVLIGSQLIILPFSLLFIVAKHLFPNKDK